MIEALFSALIVAFSLSCFFEIDAISGVNKVFLGLYKGIFEDAVYVYDQNGKTANVPYFKMDDLRQRLDEYFAISLPRYVQEYDYSLTALQMTLVSFWPQPIKVKLDLRCVISWKRTIEKTAVFAIERS